LAATRPTLGPVLLAAVGATSLLLLLQCAHERAECEPVRVSHVPRPRPPSGADTIRAVEQAGFRYEPCERMSRYRLVRAGKRPLTFDEMNELRRDLLPPTEGPVSTGIGICDCEETTAAPAGTGPPPSCVSIWIRAGDLDPPTIATLVSRRIEAMSLGDPTVRIRVDLHKKPEPRCLPSDPGCGPIPVGQMCLADVGYTPGGKRTLVFDPRMSGGDCAHDGECDSETCVTSCFSTRGSDQYIKVGGCFSMSGMKPNALCGCVAGQCNFFVQGP
jgi:hypothetical protein